MSNTSLINTPMAAAVRPTTDNRTGDWRFERPVFISGIAPCMEACPLGVDIPSAMMHMSVGDFEKAIGKIKAENPLPGVCGYACFYPCEKVCNRSRFDAPVSIRDLELFIAYEMKSEDFTMDFSGKDDSKSIAVLGSGPSVLSAIYFLRKLGWRVIFYYAGKELCEHLAVRNETSDDVRSLIKREEERILSLCATVREGFSQEELKKLDALYISPDMEQKVMETIQADGGLKKSLENISRESGNYGLLIIEDRAVSVSAKIARKEDSPEKNLVRDIAGGKRAAVLLDMALRGIPRPEINAHAIGRTGNLLFESYLNRGDKKEKWRFEKVIKYGNLNTTYFEKVDRLPSSDSARILSREQALYSASRCFNCGTCTFCYKCYDFCPDLSIIMDKDTGYREIDLDHCKGCGICAEECPRGAIDWVKEQK